MTVRRDRFPVNKQPTYYDPDAPLEAMRAHGLDPGGRIIADGEFHRWKNSTSKGWYVINEDFDHAWGAFGNYRTGEQWKWSSRRRAERMTARELADVRAEQRRKVNDEAERAEARREWGAGKARAVYKWWTRTAP